MKTKSSSCLVTSCFVFVMGGLAWADLPSEGELLAGSRPLSEKTLLLSTGQEESPTTEENIDERLFNHGTELFRRNQSPPPYRFLYDISSNDECISLDDGSQWRVNPDDLHRLLRWHKNDILLLSADTPWGDAVKKKRRYYYTLVNASRKNSVEVNLYLSTNVHNVDSLNRSGLQIYLSDGSGWRICSEDASLFQEWETEDTVLVGTYNPWNRWLTSYDSILINVDSNHYVRAKQI